MALAELVLYSSTHHPSATMPKPSDGPMRKHLNRTLVSCSLLTAVGPPPASENALHWFHPSRSLRLQSNTGSGSNSSDNIAPPQNASAARWAAAGRNFVESNEAKRFTELVELTPSVCCPFCGEQFSTRYSTYVQATHLKKHRIEKLWEEVWELFDRTHERKQCPWEGCDYAVVPGAGEAFASHLRTHGQPGKTCKMVDDGALCGQILVGHEVDTHFQVAHGLVRTTTRALTVFRLCPECSKPLVGWPEICRHLEQQHAAEVLRALKTEPEYLATAIYCPFCAFDESKKMGERMWQFIDIHQRARHVVRDHLATRPREVPTKCPFPSCSSWLKLLDLADHLSTDHSLKVTKGRTRTTGGRIEQLAMPPDVLEAYKKGRLGMNKAT